MLENDVEISFEFNILFKTYYGLWHTIQQFENEEMPSALPFCFAHWVLVESKRFSFGFSLQFCHRIWKDFLNFFSCFHSIYLIFFWTLLLIAMPKIMTSFYLHFHFPTKKEATKLHRIKRDLSNFLIGFTLPFPFHRSMAKGCALSNILWCSVFKNYTQNWVKWL